MALQPDIVVLCVRWYLSFKLSFRDWMAKLAERGSGMAHTTLLRWVQHYTAEFEKLREAIRSPGRRILADGGDLYPGQGRWAYLYRAVDQSGKTVDFYLSRKRR